MDREDCSVFEGDVWLSGPVPRNQEVIFRFVYKIFVYTKLIKST